MCCGAVVQISAVFRTDKMVDKNNKINDEKRSTKLIRKVFKEKFAQQEKKTYQTLLVETSQTTNRRS